MKISGEFEVHIIELRKPSAEAGAVGEWIQLFNVGSMGELDTIKTKNAGILEAREVLRTFNLRNPLRQMYEMHLKAMRGCKAEDAYVRDLGRAEGRVEGKAEDKAESKIELVCHKLAKGKTPETTAENLEEDLSEVQYICDATAKYAPDYDIEKILQEYLAGA